MKDLLLHNWHLKLISLAMATALWAAVARRPTSEIGMSVSVEYQNIPAQTEVLEDSTNRVEVRLRGASSLLRTIATSDVRLSIDMSALSGDGEKIVSLTPEMVHAPFGIDVVRVIPSRLRLSVEPTLKKSVRVVAPIMGLPPAGFVVAGAVPIPDTVEIEGPTSHVAAIDALHTYAIDVGGRQSTFRKNMELDIADPVIRVTKSGPVAVEVRVQPAP